MADNVSITAGSGTTIAADDIAGVLHQRVKLSQGADGSATDVSSTAPLNVTLANTGANATAVKTDSSATTQPISASSLPLPTGAATSANQTTAIGHLSTLAGAVSGTEVQADILSLPANATVDVNRINGAAVNMGTGASGLGTQRVVLASDQPAVAVTGTFWQATQPVSAASLPLPTGASTSAKQDTVIGHLDGVEALLGTIDADTGTVAGAVSGTEMQVDVVGALPAGTNTIGKVNTLPETSGGLSIFRSIDLDETEEEVKATAGQIYTLWFSNMATSTRFLKIYNATAANVTVGTTTPIMTLALPGNSSDDVSGVFGSTHGLSFDTAITVAATTGIADNDTGAPAANDVLVNIGFK